MKIESHLITSLLDFCERNDPWDCEEDILVHLDQLLFHWLLVKEEKLLNDRGNS